MRGFTPTPESHGCKPVDEWSKVAKRIYKSHGRKPVVWGFTLIELLVIVAIISLVGSLVFVQVQGARAKARDAQRESDIKTLRNALEIYSVNKRLYPVASVQTALTGSDSVSLALINADSIPTIPQDPLNTGNYVYSYLSATGSTYTITYWLETNNISGKSAGQQTVSP